MATLKQNSAALAALSEKVRSLPKRPELVEVTLIPAAEDVIATPNTGEAFSKVTVEGDANLKAENIAEGVSIFGVEGTHKGGGGDLDAFIEGTTTEVVSGATSVAKNVFNSNKIMTYAFFPNATSIGETAFQNCTVLTSADFPNATSFGYRAFYSCQALQTISAPKLTNANGVFENCSKLREVCFPQLTAITQYLHSGCRLLTTADFAKVTQINNYAFNNCNSLKTLILRSETVCSLTNTNAFSNCYHILGTVNASYNPNGDKDGYIYVPANLVDAYKSATNWSTFASQIRAIEGSDSNKLPTPELTIEETDGSIYVSNIASATTVDVYYTDEEDYAAESATWNLLYTQECVVEGDDGPVRVVGDGFWIDSTSIIDNYGVTARPLWFCAIAHAPDYEDSDPSNVCILEN